MSTSKPLKRKKEQGVYSLLITHFNDDYKPRGDSSCTNGPYLFWSEDDAKAKLEAELYEYLSGTNYDYNANIKLWNNSFVGPLTLKPKFKHMLEDIVNEQAKGEYSVRKLAWTLEYVEIK